MRLYVLNLLKIKTVYPFS